ncbi:MAG: PilZ domain-containing protein [Myxococcota bacterium]
MSPQGESTVVERVVKRTIARIPAIYAGGADHGHGYIKNLSPRGLFLRTEDLPARGDRVSVLFYVPDGGKIEVVGVVRWTTAELDPAEQARPGFGLEIDQGNEAFLDFYESLLDA